MIALIIFAFAGYFVAMSCWFKFQDCLYDIEYKKAREEQLSKFHQLTKPGFSMKGVNDEK